MNIMTEIAPVTKFGGWAELFVGVRNDGTLMVFVFDELVDHVEHDALCLLLCGDKLTANLPEHVGMTNEEYVALNRNVAATLEAEYHAEWTDERIGEHKMLHGYDPREDW